MTDAWRTYDEPPELDPSLAAALELFGDVGYHAARTRDVAIRAGLSNAGLYHHYPSKQDLLLALILRSVRDLNARLTSALAGCDEAEPDVRLERIVECLVLFYCYRRDLALVNMNEFRSLDAASRELVTRERNVNRDTIVEAIENGARQGRFASSDALQEALAILGMCVGVLRWDPVRDGASPEALARDYASYALAVVHRAERAQPGVEPAPAING